MKKKPGKLTRRIQELERALADATLDARPHVLVYPDGVVKGFSSDAVFLEVIVVKEVSLFEAALLISDPIIANKATEAIGKANAANDTAALIKMKNRVIDLLKQQE